jgi:hypothetical protein
MAQDWLGPLLSSMLECAETHLTVPVGRSTIMPGASVVWDDCCEGQLWVQLKGITATVLSTTASGEPCVQFYQHQIGIGVIRCAYVVDDSGVIPTPAEMASDAFKTFRDRADLIEAVVCCITDMEQVDSLRISSWTPLGPRGGCVGGELALSFNQVLCTPCPE